MYFVHPLGEAQSVVQDGPTGGGTVLNQNLKEVNSSQPNNYASNEGSRIWDILEDQDPQGATDALGRPLFRFYSPPYQPAIDAQGNADCQNGQNGYPNGPLGPVRYRRGDIQDRSNAQGIPFPGEFGTGANGAITENNLPGLSGGTYKLARARHRQPGGRAMSAFQQLRAGLLATRRDRRWARTSASRSRTRSRTRTSSTPSSTT